MEPWTKPHERVVDQRGEVLPPSWIERTVEPARHPASGTEAVLPSDPGRHAARRICAAIESAKQMVVVSSFLLADEGVEKCLEATAKRGVPVYLLLATEARLDREPPEDSEFGRRVLDEHKQMLRRLAGWALIRSAPGFHAKAVLVDPRSEGRGFLLTANLTKEALERNEELIVELNADECKSVFEALRWAAWEGAEHEAHSPGRLHSVKPLGRVAPPGAETRVTSTLGQPGSIAKEARRIVDGASKQLLVASFGWDAKHPIVQRLCERAREGIQVTVLCRVRPKVMPALLALREAGARVLGLSYLHAKCIVADGKEALVMSANLEREGLDTSFELGIAFQDPRVRSLLAILDAWSAAAPWELDPAPTIGKVLGKARIYRDGRLEDIEVVKRMELDLGYVTAGSADRLESDPPSLPRRDPLLHLAHDLVIRWAVRAPTLAAGAREVFRAGKGKRKRPESHSPPVFQEATGRKVVAIRDPAELPRALALSTTVGATAVVVRGGR